VVVESWCCYNLSPTVSLETTHVSQQRTKVVLSNEGDCTNAWLHT
jgi:hypothetical protein